MHFACLSRAHRPSLPLSLLKTYRQSAIHHYYFDYPYSARSMVTYLATFLMYCNVPSKVRSCIGIPAHVCTHNPRSLLQHHPLGAPSQGRSSSVCFYEGPRFKHRLNFLYSLLSLIYHRADLLLSIYLT
jgi:hypothetical protein